MRAEPGEHVIFDLRALRFVHEIVGEAVVDPQRLVGRARTRDEIAATRRGGQPILRPVDHEERDAQRAAVTRR